MVSVSLSLHSQGSQESWPALYTLPVLPPELQEALQRKDPSFKKKDKSHLRASLIQVLFDNITKYTWYGLDLYSISSYYIYRWTMRSCMMSLMLTFHINTKWKTKRYSQIYTMKSTHVSPSICAHSCLILNMIF